MIKINKLLLAIFCLASKLVFSLHTKFTYQPDTQTQSSSSKSHYFKSPIKTPLKSLSDPIDYTTPKSVLESTIRLKLCGLGITNRLNPDTFDKNCGCSQRYVSGLDQIYDCLTNYINLVKKPAVGYRVRATSRPSDSLSFLEWIKLRVKSTTSAPDFG